MSARKSERKHLIEMLICILGTETLLDLKLTTFDTETLVSLLTCLNEFRYMNPRTVIPKSTHWLDTILHNADFGGQRFRHQMRMDAGYFCYVVDLIKDSNSFTPSQDPVPVQLAVALRHLGTFGNSSSFSDISTKFGMSEGAVENCTTRVVDSLNSISTTWIKWPDVVERGRIGSHMATKYFPKCIGFIDGSDATFYRAPQDDKQSYWSRKKKYCMQFQIVCDNSKLIRSLYTGYPGSVHDAKVYTSSPVFHQIQAYFSEDEFILGDSAYPNSCSLIVPYRRRQGTLTRQQKVFNKQLSSQRVAVEHTIGIFKGRFQCLQGLRINVNKEEGHRKACKWILACAVLHNILQLCDPWNRRGDDYFNEDEEDEDEDEIPFINTNITGEQKRHALSLMVNTMCT